MKILNKKEIQEFEKKIIETYGCKKGIFKNLAVLQTGKKDKIWIATRDSFKIDFEQVKINTVGMYFGRINYRNKLKLSVEATAIVGPEATKNILELNEEETWEFLRGMDIEFEEQRIKNLSKEKFLIIKSKKNWLGIGTLEGNTLHNSLPKSRRIHSLRK